MNNEVEEFLRRAAARRAQVEAQMRAQSEAKARGQQPPPPVQYIPTAYSPPQPAAPAYGQSRPAPVRMTAAPQSLSQQQAYSGPSMAQTVMAAELAENTDRIASSVAAHLRGAEDMAQHIEQLGDRVEEADDIMEARLHQTFGHQVGRLKSSTAATTATRGDANAVAATVAQATVLGIAHMLQSPQNIQSAIILNEVFNRPIDRW